MNISDLLIPELHHEVALTEKFLRRVPQDKFDWQPHSKSMNLKQLASHLAEIPSWISGTMDMDEMDMEGYVPPMYNSVDEMVNVLKENAKNAEISLKKADEEFQKNWKMTQNGQTLMEMPKYNVLRSMVLNQLPHHRAQLGVYLRLLDESVPSSYGPSADEQ